MTLLQKIGSKAVESDFVSGDGTTNFNAMTPAQAKSEIQTLMNDKTFVAQYLAKNVEAVQKMERLHKFAYPEG